MIQLYYLDPKLPPLLENGSLFGDGKDPPELKEARPEGLPPELKEPKRFPPKFEEPLPNLAPDDPPPELPNPPFEERGRTLSTGLGGPNWSLDVFLMPALSKGFGDPNEPPRPPFDLPLPLLLPQVEPDFPNFPKENPLLVAPKEDDESDLSTDSSELDTKNESGPPKLLKFIDRNGPLGEPFLPPVGLKDPKESGLPPPPSLKPPNLLH